MDVFHRIHHNDVKLQIKVDSKNCYMLIFDDRTSRQSFLNTANRRSSIQSNGGQNYKPPSDKLAVPKQVKQLIAFLTENGYPHPLNQQNLINSPYTRDVQRIFEFLVSLGSEYSQKPGAKFDEEFPRMMKILRYPYTIGKRQLQPIGSTHNWPYILYALIWLSNQNNYSLNLEKNPLVLASDSNEEKIKSMELELNFGAYKQFMNGADDFRDHDENFLKEIPKMMRMDDVKELKEQAAVLTEKKEELSKVQENLDFLQAESKSVETDYEKIETYLDQLENFKENLATHIVQTKDANEKLKKESGVLQLEVSKKETLIAEQKVIEHNVQALKATLTCLDAQAVGKEEIAGKLHNELLESEIALAKLKEELQDAMEEYHSIAQDCNLIPVTASNSQGYDYSITLLNPEADSSQNLDEIIGRLKLIIKQWKNMAQELNINEMKAKDAAQQLEHIHSNKLQDIEFIEAKKRRQQEAIDLLIQENESEVKKLRDRISEVEEELSKLRKHDKESYDIEAMQNTNIALESEVQQLEQQGFLREQEVEEFTVRCWEIIVDHTLAVEERVRQFRNLAANCCDDVEKCKIICEFEKLREKMNLDDLEKQIDEVVEKQNCFYKQ